MRDDSGVAGEVASWSVTKVDFELAQFDKRPENLGVLIVDLDKEDSIGVLDGSRMFWCFLLLIHSLIQLYHGVRNIPSIIQLVG